MTSRMTGIKEARAALKQAPSVMKDEVIAAIRQTVNGVHSRGQSNISSMVTQRSGALLRNYRKSVRTASLTGVVGYITAKARSEAFYARFINDGTVKMAARPFHTNAVESEKEADQGRMVKARDRVLAVIAGGGRGSRSGGL